MSRAIPRLFAVVLSLALLVGTVGLASQPAWAEYGNVNEHGQGNKHVSPTFGDMTLEDYPWAFKHVEKMAAKGFIKGVGNGIFNGNADIKHEEAVIMIVRYMGLEDEAQAAMNATLPFSDAKSIDSWARGYVKIALDNNLLWMPDSSQLTRFEPNTPTTRVEAVVMLVKAAGLEAEVNAKMHQTLTFKDAATIPDAYVGYIAVGVEQGLVKGYDDNTFQPFRSVKRAEMATFLGRTDEAFPRHGDDNEVNGALVSTTATSITIENEDQRGKYTLASNCPVYLDDEPATLADLQVGDQVELELDSQDRVVFIDAQRGDDMTPIPLSLAGTVRSVTIGVGVPSTMVVRLASSAGDKAFVIAGNCAIKADSVVITVADIEVGDNVALRLIPGSSDQLAEILITRNQITSVAGTVKGLTLGTNASITIRPDHQPKDVTYSLVASGIVKVNGLVSSFAQTGITIGDRVELKLAAGKVTEVNVIRAQITSVAGIVKGLTIGANSSITIRPDNQSSNVTYALASNCVVKVDGVTSSLAQAAIVVGDRVELKLSNSQVTEVNVVRNHVTSVAGLVKGLTIGATSTITILPDSQHSNVTYTLAVNCAVKVNGKASSLAEALIVVGDRVELKLTGSPATEINVIRAQTTTVTGTVKNITINTGTYSTITLLPNGQTANVAYLVANTVVVKYTTTTAAITDIKVGDKVTLTLTTQSGLPMVTQAIITSRETTVNGTVTGINYDARTLTVTKNGVATTHIVAATAVVTLLDQSFTWDHVALNDVVTLMILDNTVTKINITVHNTSYSGAVKSVTVDAAGNHFTATISGVDRTVDVPASAEITHAGQPATFADVTVGATLVITGAFDGTKIVAAQIVIQ